MEKYTFIWITTVLAKNTQCSARCLPDAGHIYTRRGYAGVEGTPDEYNITQLEKAGLEEFIIYPEPLPFLI